MPHEHKFVKSEIHEGYEVCECGTYHSTQLADPRELYENEYWTEKNGHSFFTDQIWNISADIVEGYSKVGKALSYIKEKGTLLEIGCAPGVLLRRAEKLGHNVYGIEPDIKVIPEILLVSELKPEQIIHGYFPEVKLPLDKFDYIIALDIVEHIEDYRGFIEAIYDHLSEWGMFIMMSPIIKDGKCRERDFACEEHAWMLSFDHMGEFLTSMFKKVSYDSWREGHEIFICIK